MNRVNPLGLCIACMFCPPLTPFVVGIFVAESLAAVSGRRTPSPPPRSEPKLLLIQGGRR